MTRLEHHAAYSADSTDDEQYEVHHKYYSQFVTPALLNYIRSKMVGIEWKDLKYFNDKPLAWWDCVASINAPYGNVISINDHYISRSQLKILQESLSASSIICIYKAAARILYTESKEKS